MGYNVKTDVFEGPFDLLLHLISKQKVDIHQVSIADVADQYLGYIEHMADLDLDVASDFLLVAATLLEIKASRLLPCEEKVDLDEFGDLSPEEARELLIARLLTYKQFKNVAAELAARMEAQSRMVPRYAPLEERFLHVIPDYLESVTLRQLGLTLAEMEARREVFLLEAEHVASRLVTIDEHIAMVQEGLRLRKRVSFWELVAAGASVEEIVVTFLAILELYKRGEADVRQTTHFGDIEVLAVKGESS